MLPTSLLTTFLLAIAVAANPIIVGRSPVTLPFTKQINATNAKNLLRHDQSRAKVLRAKGEAKAAGIFLHSDSIVGSSEATNEAVAYIAAIGIGSPPTTYQLVVDTGEANICIGSGQTYVRTSTSHETSNIVSCGSGLSATGFIDEVTIASGLVIPQQSIGVVTTSTGFQGIDGMLGLGPVDLTIGTLSPSSNSEIPTVTDNLFADGTITADEVSISFEPITNSSGEQLNGELTWGGTDSSKFTGPITFTPITTTSPSSQFWGINQSIEYGTTTILSTTAGIVDTSTTLILIATNAFNIYQSSTGAVIDNNTGLLRVTSTQFADLQTLTFVIGGASFGLTPNGQIWPRILNTLIGGISGDIYLIVADIGSNSGSGLDFINGQTFVERFYSVFDTSNKRVGFATTSFTSATTN